MSSGKDLTTVAMAVAIAAGDLAVVTTSFLPRRLTALQPDTTRSMIPLMMLRMMMSMMAGAVTVVIGVVFSGGQCFKHCF